MSHKLYITVYVGGWTFSCSNCIQSLFVFTIAKLRYVLMTLHAGVHAQVCVMVCFQTVEYPVMHTQCPVGEGVKQLETGYERTTRGVHLMPISTMKYGQESMYCMPGILTF